MNLIKRTIEFYSKRARDKRARIFVSNFFIDEKTKILDLGSADGSNIAHILTCTRAKPKNVYLADIDSQVVSKGSVMFGFNPIVLKEFESLPFRSKFFDIVYCSSVIEHVTVPKDIVWDIFYDSDFKRIAYKNQRDFAYEIQRVGRQYFVQTPNRYFFIESHMWLPLIQYLPRHILLPFLRYSNLLWVKQTSPNWHLLNKSQMTKLFHGSTIIEENAFGMCKSLLALNSELLS